MLASWSLGQVFNAATLQSFWNVYYSDTFHTNRTKCLHCATVYSAKGV